MKELGISLAYDIARATLHLFAILRGLEYVRQEQGNLYAQVMPEDQANTRFQLKPSYMDGHPMVADPHHPLDDLKIGGAVEQLAYRAWIVDVFSRWEHGFRPQMKEAAGTRGIYAQINVMNDLRYIRHDILHAHAIASNAQYNNCEVLRWFEHGQPMIFQMKHVLDAVHQMGWLRFIGGFTSDGSRVATWENTPRDELRRRQPVPKIISLKTQLVPHHETNEIWAGFSIVYDNGFLTQPMFPTGRQASDQAFDDLKSLLEQVRITEDGDLTGPEPWLCMSGRRLYPAAIDQLERHARGDEPPKYLPKDDLSGPWIKISE